MTGSRSCSSASTNAIVAPPGSKTYDGCVLGRWPQAKILFDIAPRRSCRREVTSSWFQLVLAGTPALRRARASA